MTLRARRPLLSIARLLLAVGLSAAVVATIYGADAQKRVYVLPTSGVVDQVMAGYLRDGIARAERDGAAAVVVELDTPGGALSSTHEIVKTTRPGRRISLTFRCFAG